MPRDFGIPMRNALTKARQHSRASTSFPAEGSSEVSMPTLTLDEKSRLNAKSPLSGALRIKELSDMILGNIGDRKSLVALAESCRMGYIATESYAPTRLDASQLPYLPSLRTEFHRVRRVTEVDFSHRMGNGLTQVIPKMPSLKQVDLVGSAKDVFGDEMSGRIDFSQSKTSGSRIAEYFDVADPRYRYHMRQRAHTGRWGNGDGSLFHLDRLPRDIFGEARYIVQLTPSLDHPLDPRDVNDFLMTRFERQPSVSEYVLRYHPNARYAPYNAFCDPEGRHMLARYQGNDDFISGTVADLLSHSLRSQSTGKDFGILHLPCIPSDVSALDKIGDVLRKKWIAVEHLSFSIACGQSEFIDNDQYSTFSEVMAGSFWRKANAQIISVDIRPSDIDLKNVVPTIVHSSLTEMRFIVNRWKPDGEKLGAYCTLSTLRPDIKFTVSRTGGKPHPSDDELNKQISESARRTWQELLESYKRVEDTLGSFQSRFRQALRRARKGESLGARRGE